MSKCKFLFWGSLRRMRGPEQKQTVPAPRDLPNNIFCEFWNDVLSTSNRYRPFQVLRVSPLERTHVSESDSCLYELLRRPNGHQNVKFVCPENAEIATIRAFLFSWQTDRRTRSIIQRNNNSVASRRKNDCMLTPRKQTATCASGELEMCHALFAM